jgi:4-hydroxythreonine-4-phosphate dehydrogenase
MTDAPDPARRTPAAEPPDPDAPLALTMGEPAGIGGEIALAAWLQRETAGFGPFVLLDDPERIRALAGRLGWNVPVRAVDRAGDATAAFAEALPVLPHPLPVHPAPGKPDGRTAETVLAAIRAAVRLTRAGETAAIVTNPIAKHVLHAGGFDHPGHTEYLAALAADGGTVPQPVMLLTCPELSVVPVTIHVPIAEVPDRLTQALIAHAGRVTAAALARDFEVAAPRLAVAGLNPHAGEGGSIGREDIDVVAPACETLRAGGIDVDGPLSADTMFHPRARRRFDAALCMYHDQALIPIKTVDFARGVNVTLGLPFVRTSPDHGTAFAIAGTGRADPTSLIEALKTARRMARGRARNAGAAGA